MSKTLTVTPPAMPPVAAPAAPAQPADVPGPALTLPIAVTDIDELWRQVDNAQAEVARANAALSAAIAKQPTALDAFHAGQQARDLEPVTLFLANLPAVSAQAVEVGHEQLDAAAEAYAQAVDFRDKAPAKRVLTATRAYVHALEVLHDKPDSLPAALADVEAADAALITVKARIPTLLQARQDAEDSEDGTAFQTAEATLRGLPRKVGTATAAKVTTTARYLALIHDLGKANAARITYEQSDLERERRAIISEIHRHDSRSGDGPTLTSSEQSILERDLQSVSGQLERFATETRWSEEASTAARIRASFLGDAIDFGFLSTIETAATAASEKAAQEARREINSNGK